MRSRQLKRTMKRMTNRLMMNLRSVRCLSVAACAGLYMALSFLALRSANGQEVKIWEFSPYEVEIWYAFDENVTVSQAAREKFLQELDSNLNRTFRAAWRTTFTEMPSNLAGYASRDFAALSLDDLTHNELVLVVSGKHPDTKTLRTFDAAVMGLSEIYVSAEAKQSIESSMLNLSLPEDSPTAHLVSKLSVEEGGPASIKEKLLAGTIAGALIQRTALDVNEKDIRAIITTLPWQTEAIFRARDKLLFLMIGMESEAFTLKTRELDCPMQFMGTSFEATTNSFTAAAQVATNLLAQAFAPVARVEGAEAKTATVRHRAGGLITSDGNPARIVVGDVLQPIIRRDDRNGIPTLLEPLAFTFAAVTASDGVKMDVNVYTYSGGPGLQGQKNRRTQRVLLKVRPRYSQSELKIAVRGQDGKVQAGCFVYERNWLTEDFELRGRTDWRGQFTVAVPSSNGAVLPEAIRKERFKAKVAAQEKAAAEKAAAEAAAQESGDSEVPSTPPPSTVEVAQVETIEIDPNNDPDAIPLNTPLLQIYVKSGETVLAKLPMVPGLQPIEVAQLPDDSHRLQSEAFVRGFQGEILDLIGLRNLLAARVTFYIKEQKFERAAEALAELRSLKTYDEMAVELSNIQNRMLKESGDIPAFAKSGIDRMFQTTRDMLQKYLQDNLLTKAESEYAAAKPAATESAAM
jgi:hypothetical protein